MTPPMRQPRALPPEARIGMPRQPVSGRLARLRHSGGLRHTLATGLARLFVLTGTLALAVYGVREMHGVISPNGITLLQWVFLGLFAINFVWVSASACQALLGFVRELWMDLAVRRPATSQPPGINTAILIPIYNEDAGRIAALIETLVPGLSHDAPGRFSIFVLSDTTDPKAWLAEEAILSPLMQGPDAPCPVHYRHRRDNTERKPGNIADWVERWGGAFEAMAVLDADSIMAPETLVEMARRIERDEGLGLIQTLPKIARARSFYARLQQFANRCYGPVFGNGLAAWHGRSGNFWGHNAIIRVRAFADAAGLPHLKGKPPFGGAIMSHDFIEAALLRRAGWGVRMDTDLTASYEETPPSYLDTVVRDRRWAQGNLQHTRFVFARGLTLATRLHLMTGIMAYLSAVLWLLLFAVGLVVAFQAAVARPEYFSSPSLFPNWPVFDSERAISLFIVSMTVVLLPKLLGALAILLRPRRLIAFGGPIALGLSLVTEILFSALYAPVLMISQSQIVGAILSGQRSDWLPQRRNAGGDSLWLAVQAKRWQIACGAGVAIFAWWLEPDLFLWTLPVTLGLIIAAPLAWISGSLTIGTALKRFGVLRTPEEHKTRSGVLETFEEHLNTRGQPDAGFLSRLASDPALRRWHLAQLPGDVSGMTPFDPALILGQAKADRARNLRDLEVWLSRDEAMALLHDRSFISGLSPVGDTARA